MEKLSFVMGFLWICAFAQGQAAPNRAANGSGSFVGSGSLVPSSEAPGANMSSVPGTDPINRGVPLQNSTSGTSNLNPTDTSKTTTPSADQSMAQRQHVRRHRADVNTKVNTDVSP